MYTKKLLQTEEHVYNCLDWYFVIEQSFVRNKNKMLLIYVYSRESNASRHNENTEQWKDFEPNLHEFIDSGLLNDLLLVTIVSTFQGTIVGVCIQPLVI